MSRHIYRVSNSVYLFLDDMEKRKIIKIITAPVVLLLVLVTNILWWMVNDI